MQGFLRGWMVPVVRGWVTLSPVASHQEGKNKSTPGRSLAGSEFTLQRRFMGYIFDINRFALHDGPGLRTTVFMKGCPLSCLSCHNPEGQRVGPELQFRADRCTACGDCVSACPNGAITLVDRKVRVDRDRCELTGACVEVCLPGALEMMGKPRSVQEILDILEDDRIYFDESGGGVTFSGGEPFSQPDFLRELLNGCRELEIPVVLDTCGHVAPETFRELAPQAGGLLFDLKLMDEARHEAFTGVHNRWILENLAWAGNGCSGELSGGEESAASESVGSPAGGVHPTGRGVVVPPGAPGGGARTRCPTLTVRIPLIPGLNDDEENLAATAEFLLGLAKVPSLDILPYHRLGVDKYHRMGREYHLSELEPPQRASISNAVRILRDAGLEVTVRGERYGDV